MVNSPSTDSLPRAPRFTPARSLKVVDFVCRKMQKQMSSDVSLGGSWFKLFKRYDRDSSGLVEFGELEYVLRKEVKILKTEISDEELHLLWGTFDSDGSGYITIKEFSGFMRRYARFGANSFAGKVPITPMGNVKELALSIMMAGKAMMKEDNRLSVEDLEVQFRGTEYEQFVGWLMANVDRFDEDASGTIDIKELEAAIGEFIHEMERDKARIQSSKSLKSSSSTPALHTAGPLPGIPGLGSSASASSLPGVRGYRTIAGYSSISRQGPIMGQIPFTSESGVQLHDRLLADLQLAKELRNRYEETTFTGAPATSLTPLPIESYVAGAHLNSSVETRWGGWRSRYDRPILIKNTILPPEERRFLEQVRESHKPSMWPKPLEKGMHWCQKLNSIPTMCQLLRKQQKFEDFVGKIVRDGDD